jgi:hypothetical protein
MKSLLFLALVIAVCAAAQTPNRKDSPMSHRAAGSFDVKVAPLEPYNKDDKALGRYSLDKQFHGDIDGTSKGEMLAFGTGAPGSSGGAVAIEKVTGKLGGKSGSFVLAHRGTMDAGKPTYSIIVVPGSGTGELTGISGTMDILNEAGKHSYVFEYTLP